MNQFKILLWFYTIAIYGCNQIRHATHMKNAEKNQKAGNINTTPTLLSDHTSSKIADENLKRAYKKQKKEQCCTTNMDFNENISKYIDVDSKFVSNPIPDSIRNDIQVSASLVSMMYGRRDALIDQAMHYDNQLENRMLQAKHTAKDQAKTSLDEVAKKHRIDITDDHIEIFINAYEKHYHDCYAKIYSQENIEDSEYQIIIEYINEMRPTVIQELHEAV
ncbi:hypothetical protein ACRRVB_02585 [Candidatus Cardinium hertigii]|uniref:hypothetical protein n=1 Tax=Candidatus Cardinium hertigii TaxID=247481 RepID=UPI003D7C63C5